jgi:hypothetical protein
MGIGWAVGVGVGNSVAVGRGRGKGVASLTSLTITVGGTVGFDSEWAVVVSRPCPVSGSVAAPQPEVNKMKQTAVQVATLNNTASLLDDKKL